MGYSMKGSPHKMGTIKGTSSHSSAVKQKTIREQELEFAKQKEANRQKELERQRELESQKREEKEKGKEGRKASEKWTTKRNENIDAYNQEIKLLEESGASQKEIDKVRRKKDRESGKLEKGQFDWKEFAKVFGTAVTGLGRSWGTGRWLGGPPIAADLRREVDEGEGEEEVEDMDATDKQAETKETTATEAYEGKSMKDFPLRSTERKAEYDRRGWKYDETIEGYDKEGQPTGVTKHQF